jgi:hypothetical protein
VEYVSTLAAHGGKPMTNFSTPEMVSLLKNHILILYDKTKIEFLRELSLFQANGHTIFTERVLEDRSLIVYYKIYHSPLSCKFCKRGESQNG